MKEIEIIPIALKKAERRGIVQTWIEETVRHPEQVVEGYGGRKVAHKKMVIDEKECLLRVIYEEIGDKYVVVTTYLTSQISRYWKEDE